MTTAWSPRATPFRGVAPPPIFKDLQCEPASVSANQGQLGSGVERLFETGQSPIRPSALWEMQREISVRANLKTFGFGKVRPFPNITKKFGSSSSRFGNLTVYAVDLYYNAKVCVGGG